MNEKNNKSYSFIFNKIWNNAFVGKNIRTILVMGLLLISFVSIFSMEVLAARPMKLEFEAANDNTEIELSFLRYADATIDWGDESTSEQVKFSTLSQLIKTHTPYVLG